MQKDICKAITSSGKRCSRRPNETGFCKIHEKKVREDEKKEKYRDVISVVLSVCKTKGWGAYLQSEDKNYQFATIHISKYVEHAEITGLLNITVGKVVKFSVESTSFHSYGQSDLLDAIGVKIHELDWIEKKKNDVEKVQKPNNHQILISLLKNFDKVARQLTYRHNNRASFEIKDEYDAQDLLQALLRGYFDDVRREEYTPSYAGSSVKVDFLLKDEKIVIEIKLATMRLKDKLIGEQLIIDMKKYKTHPDCNYLYCLVYDPNGNIRNPMGFEKDLSGKDGSLSVAVLVVPH